MRVSELRANVLSRKKIAVYIYCRILQDITNEPTAVLKLGRRRLNKVSILAMEGETSWRRVISRTVVGDTEA